MGRRRERHHVHAGLGEDRLRGTDGHAGHGLYQRGGVSKRAHGLVDAGIQRGDVSVQRLNQREVLLEEKRVVRREPTSEPPREGPRASCGVAPARSAASWSGSSIPVLSA